MSSALTTKKFGRNFLFTANRQSYASPLQFGLPFTIEFDIDRNNYSSTNHASFRIYNLSKEHRNLLTYDQWTYDIHNPLQVTFNAGYGTGPNWPVCFSGNVTRAWSYREGTNFVTTIQCFDGGTAFTNAYTNKTFSQGQSIAQVYNELISDLLPFGISRGTVSEFLGTLDKACSFCGSTIDILRELSNNNFFIDNLKANILSQADAIGGNGVVINAASGILGTPLRENQWLLFDILLEPRLVIGSAVNLQASTSLETYNGIHKVISVHHKGMISPAVCGDAITSLGVEGGVFNQLANQVGL